MLLYDNFTIMLRYSVKLSFRQFAREIIDNIIDKWNSIKIILKNNKQRF